MDYPVTPDGRYMAVRGRLWRLANPNLEADLKSQLVSSLMTARRAVKTAMKSGDRDRLTAARAEVHKAKVALGERGPVWWEDGDRDWNRHMVVNTPYKGWYESCSAAGESSASPRTELE